MKNKVLEIHFQSLADFKKEVTQAIALKKPAARQNNIIVFASVSGFRNFLTAQKIEILSVLSSCAPKSIYALAQCVERDYAGVLRDCVGLEATGFISLKDAKDVKASKRPKLKFPYQQIVIKLPNSPYLIEFVDVA